MNILTKEQLFKQIIKENIKDQTTTNIVDATCGNGYDLEFLSKSFPKSNIWAIDIQSTAIKKSFDKCNDLKKDINYFTGNHLDFFQNTKEQFNLVIFNTGYLPNSETNITTEAINTIKTLEKILIKLKLHGIIMIMLYTGHDDYKEHNAVYDYLIKLNKYEYIVFKYETVNVKGSPILYMIEKK